MRLFTAIGLDSAVTDRLLALKPAAAAGWRKTRWVNREQLHITLRFIGEVRPDAGAHIRSKLRKVEFSPFRLQISGLGTFGRHRSPHVVWAGIDACPEIIKLFKEISYAIDNKNNNQNFTPHITLARFRGSRPIELDEFISSHQGFSIPAFQVDCFTLYLSTLKPAGAVHEALEHYPAMSS